MSLLMYPDSMPKQILRAVTLTFSQMGKMNVKEKKKSLGCPKIERTKTGLKAYFVH